MTTTASSAVPSTPTTVKPLSIAAVFGFFGLTRFFTFSHASFTCCNVSAGKLVWPGSGISGRDRGCRGSSTLSSIEEKPFKSGGDSIISLFSFGEAGCLGADDEERGVSCGALDADDVTCETTGRVCACAEVDCCRADGVEVDAGN